MKKSIIVAMASNRLIGANNQLPWHMPADMRFFRQMTQGHPIIMGRKTFESMGSKPLKNRTNIILTRKASTLPSPEGYHLACNLEEAFQKAAETGASELFVIGGSQIYSEALPLVDTLYISEIHAHIQGDTYFPLFSTTEWKEVSRDRHKSDQKHAYDYDFVTYDRKKRQ